jgi:hypothetical protein
MNVTSKLCRNNYVGTAEKYQGQLQKSFSNYVMVCEQLSLRKNAAHLIFPNSGKLLTPKSETIQSN